MTTRIIAHRTCPNDAPENSLSGMKVSAKRGADGVEIDLRLSLDQQPFLMHDWSMRRTAGFFLPVELTPSILIRRFRLRGSSEPVPSLADAFDSLDPGLSLAVDVKTPWAVRRLVREVRRRQMESRTLAWCTSAQAVRYLVRTAPTIETAYLNDVKTPQGKVAFINKAAALGAAAISAHWDAIDDGFVAAAHASGLRVYSYHKQFALTPEKLLAGLDGLITDSPQEALKAIEAVS